MKKAKVKLQVTKPCKDCPHFDPNIQVQLPHIDQDGHFVETEYTTWCSHEKVCYKLKEEGG